MSSQQSAQPIFSQTHIMILEEDVIQIGYLSRTHGKQGSVQCQTDTEFLAEADPEFVILKIDNIFVPFRLVDWREKNREAYILTLQDVDTEDKGARLVGTEVYMLRADITDNTEEPLTMQDLIGFSVIDTNKGAIGTIADVDESTINTLFLLDGGAVIPAHDDFVEDINYSTRQIFLTLPEGLI